MLWLLPLAALAQELPCQETNLAELVATPPPAVMVLGVRSGTQPDLWRAQRVVQRLGQSSEVTLALQVIPAEQQRGLDSFADGEFSVEGLPEQLDWETTIQSPWPAWRWLVSGALQGHDVLAVGPEPKAPPSWQRVTVPRGYASTLALGMPESWEVDKTLEADLVRSVAWTEQQVAKQAVNNWSGRGYLVLVVERPHATGLGVPWQVRQISDTPVTSVMMAWAAEPACEPTDKVWRRGLYDVFYPKFVD